MNKSLKAPKYGENGNSDLKHSGRKVFGYFSYF